MAERRNWTREETLMAFALYLVLPSGKHDKKNEDIIALAEAIGRTPDAVVFKLANIKANDPMRKGAGLAHASRLDQEVWVEYSSRGDDLTAEATSLLLDATDDAASPRPIIEYVSGGLPEGGERPVVATARVNQTYFRNALMENYDSRCCLTGLASQQLLVASHIKPWSEADPATERLSPENGLLLNALHDRAFDKGLMTIDFDLTVVISSKVPRDEASSQLLWRYDGQRINVPGRFKPRREFIEYHQDVVFKS